MELGLAHWSFTESTEFVPATFGWQQRKGGFSYQCFCDEAPKLVKKHVIDVDCCFVRNDYYCLFQVVKDMFEFLIGANKLLGLKDKVIVSLIVDVEEKYNRDSAHDSSKFEFNVENCWLPGCLATNDCHC